MDGRLFQNDSQTHQPKRRQQINPNPPLPRTKTRSAYRPREPKEFTRAAAFYSHQLPEAAPGETCFRHGHWSVKRNRIRSILATAGASAHQLNRWDACGGQCGVEWSDELQKHRLRANYCKSRHCEPCARAKANTIARNLRTQLEEERKRLAQDDPIGIRFVTLTLRHNRAPLAKQIQRLYACFKALRQTEVWKHSQQGGAVILEVKHTGAAWHPHLHVITAGRYLCKRELSTTWHDVTGDSFIVDVRALKDVAEACHYVTKYVTKGVDASVWKTDNLSQEWITASRGVRVCNTFGTWRGFRLLERKSAVEDWKPVASLLQIIEQAHAGSAWAQGVLLDLRPPGATQELPPSTHPPP